MFNFGNLPNMMQQLKNMQADISAAKDELSQQSFYSESDGVRIKMTGFRQITDIDIDKSMMELDNKEALEQAVLRATNDVMQQVEDEVKKKMSKYADNFPGGLPF